MLRTSPWRFAPLALAAQALVFFGCDHKIDEPIPDARPLDPSSVAQTAPERVIDPLGAQGRCIRKSAANAIRPVPPSPDPHCPIDPEQARPLAAATVAFPGAKGGELSIGVEVTSNDHDRQRGLMFRKFMAEDKGMIFVFDVKDDHAFWMHNTCIPLDMLYIDDDGLIVGIEENTPTMSDQTFSVGCASKYVLEVNAGWTRKHGVTAGQKVRIDGL